jgi:hypothetical protein
MGCADRFSILLLVPFDPPNEALDNGRLGDQVSVDVKGANGCQVALDGLGLDAPSKAGAPRHDGKLCRGKTSDSG